jgi:hypothetical protein
MSNVDMASVVPSSVVLDPASGDITFGEFFIPLQSKLIDLSSSFSRTEHMTHVEGEVVPCVLASASLQERETRFELRLRYEQGMLVSAALSIEPRHFRDLEGDAFYESSEARYSYHKRWLERMSLPSSGYTEMPWGAVGVARDKSESVFIFLQAGKTR